jgi:phosphotransferase system enzyme I (PtsI)
VEITLQGIGVSPGIAIGPALRFNVDVYDVPHYRVSDADAEVARLERALEETRVYLSDLHRRTAAELGESHADIFNAHLMLLDDVAMRDEVIARVRAEGVNAEHVLQDFIQRYARVLAASTDPRFQERAADLVDVGDRVLRNLLDAERPNLTALDQASVVVAHDLSPSDTATMDLDDVLAVVLDSGSATSHTAILTRALEVPAVVGLSVASAKIETNDRVIVDGAAGLVIARPTDETLRHYQQARRAAEVRRQALDRAASAGPARTLDGVAIPLQANIELPLEVPHGCKARAQGIGLYRTEYLFLNRSTLPDEEEQHANYRRVAEAMLPHPVVVRTIDIGGDKLVEHLQLLREENPQLGWRAVRFCLARPDVFKVQLRAILRASVVGNIEIMFPMISGLEELREVKAVLREVMADLDREGLPYKHDLRVGSMIEVPSAVAITDLLARECDFFSIGTNDLIQYSLAVDRGNEKIAHLYEPAHPAVLRMIRQTAAAARAAGIPCGMCGEMAGDPLFTELLIGLGLTSLSMSAVALPLVRAEVANTSMAQARALADEVMGLGTAAEIRALLQARFEARGAMSAYLAALGDGAANGGEQADG